MKFDIETAKTLIKIKGDFCEDSFIELSKESLEAVKNGSLIIKLKVHGKGRPRKRFSAYIGATSGEVNVSTGGNDQKLTLADNVKGFYTLRMTGNSSITIGSETTSNGCTIYTHDSGFECGTDCMISSDILIQASDQHGIVDLTTGNIVNEDYTEIVLGNHVWLGRSSTVVPNTKIGNGAIVGTAAVVTNNVPEQVAVVGSPARIVKTNITWTREKNTLDAYSSLKINNHLSQQK
jgi:acetyltransferase-like isoleucine patch superfamily enzyme